MESSMEYGDRFVSNPTQGPIHCVPVWQRESQKPGGDEKLQFGRPCLAPKSKQAGPICTRGKKAEAENVDRSDKVPNEGPEAKPG